MVHESVESKPGWAPYPDATRDIVRGARSRVFKTDALISVSRLAPAFRDVTYEVEAVMSDGDLGSGCNIKAPENGSKASTTIQSAYFPSTYVKPGGSAGTLHCPKSLAPQATTEPSSSRAALCA